MNIRLVFVGHRINRRVFSHLSFNMLCILLAMLVKEIVKEKFVESVHYHESGKALLVSIRIWK